MNLSVGGMSRDTFSFFVLSTASDQGRWIQIRIQAFFWIRIQVEVCNAKIWKHFEGVRL